MGHPINIVKNNPRDGLLPKALKKFGISFTYV